MKKVTIFNNWFQSGKGNSVCREHEEFFVLSQRETLSVSLLSNQPGA